LFLGIDQHAPAQSAHKDGETAQDKNKRQVLRISLAQGIDHLLPGYSAYGENKKDGSNDDRECDVPPAVGGFWGSGWFVYGHEWIIAWGGRLGGKEGYSQNKPKYKNGFLPIQSFCREGFCQNMFQYSNFRLGYVGIHYADQFQVVAIQYTRHILALYC
jgi:hypothetical protein